ncbi:sensor histidine kinase [Dyella mobilis]|uniref:Histidine kinase n=1 Tax=Dyella mobilis TaxID=1849582 RepID=A0ABS2KD61_9GAMM|nr:histidine kinase [Dyella mobilis]MBM7128770.1 histidine kinase [Dyella mobilis]GLQ99101.1 hypothetical protein GCM10007863_35210 [Dyella mobilis]
MPRMGQDSGQIDRRRFWLCQVAGWLAYGLVSALGALPYRDTYPVLLYFLGTSVAAFFASLVMLALSRHLIAKRAPWLKTIVLTVAVAYVLGIACSTTGTVVEALCGHAKPGGVHWSSVALVGFANAFAPAIMLLAWSALYRGAWQWREAGERERQLLAAESLAREAELKALRYQITPHFLFNALNGISTLVGEGETQAARRMISLLANFLRSTLEPSQHGDVTIAQELTQVMQYVEIERVRLGQRLVVSVHCDPAVRDTQIPHLLLQPLVENAIRHGIAAHTGEGRLSITVTSEGSDVRIRIENSTGATQEHGNAAGVGLNNTAERLAARYKNNYRFSTSVDAQRGWNVTIEVPRQALAGVA